MKRIFVVLFLLLGIANVAWAEQIKISAIEIGPELIRKDFDLAYASTMKGNGRYEPKVLYISRFHVIHIKIINDSGNILNVNPNYFTLVTSTKRSCSYSSETHGFKQQIRFIGTSPISSVDVYPGTSTEGFLLFEKQHEDERPKTLYFKNLNKHISTEIVLDKKVKK